MCKSWFVFPLVLMLLLLSFSPGARAANIHINEFVSENLPRANDPTAPMDMDSEYPDWIEIRNNEAVAVNLAGHSLSDDPALPTKWTFASNSVAAGGYLIVYASGKNRAIPGVQAMPQRHHHQVEFQMVYVLKGWIRFDYEGVGEVTLSAGSCVHQPPGIRHTELGHSDDLELVEIVLPADFETVND